MTSPSTRVHQHPVRIGVSLVSDRPVAELVSLARTAEVCGFTDVWLTDLQLARRDVYVALGAMAAATDIVRLGPMVTNPTTRHLSVTASAIATIDEVSGGRTVCGIGAGRAAVKAIGGREATLAECRRAVTDLRSWFAGEAVERDGTSTRLDAFGHRPIPVQLSASGPRMLELGGEVADGVIFISGATPELAQYAHDRIDIGMSRRLDPVPPARVHYVPCLLPGDGEEALAQARSIARFHASVLLLPAELAGPRLTSHSADPHLRGAPPMRDDVADDLIDRFVLTGSHEEIARRADELVALGVEQLALWPVGEPNRFLRTFAAEVAPRLKHKVVIDGS